MSRLNTVLVVGSYGGSGGREHALAWKLSRSPRVGRVIVAPGNDGFPSKWERWPAPDQPDKDKKDPTPFGELAKRAKAEGVDLVVVGPDNPLADGIVDALEGAGLRCFGPSQAAARIESSKAFAKHVMQSAGVPTAKFFEATTLAEAAVVLNALPWPPQMGSGWVVKADGLALGKGVHVCGSQQEAFHAAEELLPISGRIIIEERLAGEELSWMAFADGERCALLEPARDYKRARDGDIGPNTGGMGAFSPVPELPPGLAEKVRSQVFLPALTEMKKRGCPFRGLLYAGLMFERGKSRFWVLEFNARFGDPETQVLLPRMDADLFEWCDAVARRDLSALPANVPFRKESAVVIVGAAKGYPESPEKGQAIAGLPDGEEPETQADPDYFVSGVARAPGGGLVTSGGRVFGALGMGGALEQARDEAYRRLARVSFSGMQFRRDIAQLGTRIGFHDED